MYVSSRTVFPLFAPGGQSMFHRKEVFMWKAIRSLLALTVGLSLVGLPAFPSRAWPAEDIAPLTAAEIDRHESPTRAQTSEIFRSLPLSFEANRGQTDPDVAFIARGRRQTVFLTPREAVLMWRGSAPSMHGQRAGSTALALRVQFVGANARSRVVGTEELPGKVNYLL